MVDDTFPTCGAVESQWTLGEIVTAVLGAGLRLLSLEEYAEPFHRRGGVDAVVRHGRLPNAFSPLACRPA